MSRSVIFLGSVLAVILAIIGYFMTEGGRLRADQLSINIFSPLWRSIDFVKEGAENMRLGWQSMDSLQQQVVQLSDENVRLAAENSVLRGLVQENSRLKEMLGFMQDSNYQLLAARVVARDPSSWWNSVIVNRGWRDDPSLAPDQPVVSPRGVVGKTGVVGPFTTRVILLIDENCKISSVTEVSRSRGIVQGATTIQGGTPQTRMTFIPRESGLAVGERVFTTGLGGTFPANLLVGSVSEAPPLTADRNFGLFREARVQPAVDINNLEEVFIIMGVK